MTKSADYNKLDAMLAELLDNPPVDGVYLPSINTFIDGAGQRMTRMHNEEACGGRNCAIHNPSNHNMRHLPLVYRYSDIGVEPIVAERVCEHGTGHPDPDWLEFIRERHGDRDYTMESNHGCDGCCS